MTEEISTYEESSGVDESDLLAEYQERLRQYEDREAQLLYAAEIGRALLEENQQLKEITKRLEIENEDLLNKNQALEIRCTTLDELKRLSEEEMAKLNEEISVLEQQLRASRNELKASAQIASQFKQLQAELDSWKEETSKSKEAEESQRKINAQLSLEISLVSTPQYIFTAKYSLLMTKQCVKQQHQTKHTHREDGERNRTECYE
eukprot:TRINITY_DN511_c0_g1_i9.p1 TRINITY_DN511_c0_g1~~TRINITY_DN511_c0_g1_i9.p1  ORF type:complete len:238 (-),score=69.58 TRINITY_DN511_c0_g1_i9:182-799(-)